MLSFKWINSNSLSWKKYCGDNLTSPPQIPPPPPLFSDYKVKIRRDYKVKKLIEPSDTLNYKPFFKHGILQSILHVFLLFIFAWIKIFFFKNWDIFYIFLICFELAFAVTVWKVLYFWCSLYRDIASQGFFSYSRCNFLGIAIKTVF